MFTCGGRPAARPRPAMLLSPPSPVPPACGPAWGWSASWGRSHIPRSGSGQEGPGMRGPEQLDHPHRPRAHLSCCLPSSRSGPGPGWTWSGAPRALLPAGLPAGKSGKNSFFRGWLRKMATPAPLSPAHLGLVCLSTKPFGPPTGLQPICARLPPISRPRLPGRLRLRTKHAARTALSPAHQPSTGTLESRPPRVS